MSDILRMLELFEMNHEFSPAAQRDIEEIIAAVRSANAQQEEAKAAEDVVLDAERWRLIISRGAYLAGPYSAWIVRLPYAETFEHAANAMLAAKAKEGGA